MLKPGQDFAQFKILEKLGEGGMGVVYLAEDQKLRRKVALKILAAEFMGDPDRRERFQREARTAASISHPNVTGIFDIEEADAPESDRHLAYIVMEYVRGEPLNRYLESRDLDMATLFRLGEKIAAGLAAAHRLKIVHRDIKPENIIITGDDEPKILDFGLAKPIAAPMQQADGFETDRTVDEAGATVTWEEKNLTQEGRIVGTVNYMSPEQARGEQLDTRSDIFSFGILLYQMATGETPFGDSTQVSVLAKIIEKRQEPASTKNSAIPPGLDVVLDRCLEKNPANRYQDTQELVADMRVLRRQFESGVSESLTASRDAITPVRTNSSSRLVVRIGLVVAVVAAIAVAFQLFRGDSGSVADAGENNLAILGFENKTEDEDLDWMTTGLPEILLTDLAQVNELAVISRSRVHDALKKSGKDDEAGHEDWVDASRKMGASQVLSGSFYRLGDKIRIDARLEDTGSGDILFADKVIGANPIELVDSLSAMVVAKLNVTRSAPGGVASMMTSSPEAYKFYHQGDALLLIGRDAEAVKLYEQALAVDSTFALPYMRIGMSHVNEGRQQQGATYIVKALEYKDKLSPKDRGLLDIYADVWLNQEYGDANTKMAAFVEAYPEDKEAISLYGALLVGLSADTTQGFAMLEKALELDPTYPFALSIYASTLAQFEHFERGIVLLERLRDAYPDSPDSYEGLGIFHAEIGNLDKAFENYEEFRKRFPDDPDIIPDMAVLAIRERDFERSRRYVEQIPEVRPDDLQWERTRQFMLGNVDTWEGHFRSALDHYHRAAAAARRMGDSQVLYASLTSLAIYHGRFNNPDSSIHYFDLAREHAPPFGKMTYPTQVVEEYPDRAEEMRPVLREAINEFKAHTPEALWGLADGVNDVFEAMADRDTVGLVSYYRGLMERPVNQRGPGTERNLGKYLTLTGEYEEALPHLEEAKDTSSAWRFIDGTYWMGRAQEGLGNSEEAIKLYEEILEYWGDADFEIEAIEGAREGLARLTS